MLPIVSELNALVDRLIDDNVIIHDVVALLEEINWVIQFDGNTVVVPRDTAIVVIKKIFIRQVIPMVYLGPVKVIVSIGNAVVDDNNFVSSQYAFCYLYYNDELQLITTDLTPEYW